MKQTTFRIWLGCRRRIRRSCPSSFAPCLVGVPACARLGLEMANRFFQNVDEKSPFELFGARWRLVSSFAWRGCSSSSESSCATSHRAREMQGACSGTRATGRDGDPVLAEVPIDRRRQRQGQSRGLGRMGDHRGYGCTEILRARGQALERMREDAAIRASYDKTKKGATKNKAFSIPLGNNTAKATGRGGCRQQKTAPPKQ